MAGCAAKALVHKADFERLLAGPPQRRSTHFAVHHLPGRPSGPKRPLRRTRPGELSTVGAPERGPPVDDCPDRWLGTMVPKRHARRAVTRNLLKRQMRAAVARHHAHMAPGLWLVRLKAPFALDVHCSAASAGLRAAARGELDGLLAPTRP